MLNIGTDIIEIDRMANTSEGFRRRVFTECELAYAKSRGRQETASLAGMFSAKEAVVKALGTGMRYGAWREMEITRDESGAPAVRCTGAFARVMKEKHISCLKISISHCRLYATACAVALFGEGEEG